MGLFRSGQQSKWIEFFHKKMWIHFEVNEFIVKVTQPDCNLAFSRAFLQISLTHLLTYSLNSPTHWLTRSFSLRVGCECNAKCATSKKWLNFLLLFTLLPYLWILFRKVCSMFSHTHDVSFLSPYLSAFMLTCTKVKLQRRPFNFSIITAIHKFLTWNLHTWVSSGKESKSMGQMKVMCVAWLKEERWRSKVKLLPWLQLNQLCYKTFLGPPHPPRCIKQIATWVPPKNLGQRLKLSLDILFHACHTHIKKKEKISYSYPLSLFTSLSGCG